MDRELRPRFYLPRSLQVEASGSIIVQIIEITASDASTASGLVTTLAGDLRHFGSTDGTGAGALFGLPIGVAIDPRTECSLGFSVGT
eukprot:gene21305-28236_t